MTNSPMRDLLLALLVMGILSPTASADEGSEHRPDQEETAGRPHTTGSDPIEIGPPDPNGCRPYCK